MENGDIAISVSHLSKMFRLFDSKSHRMAEALNPFGKVYHREHWALRDINFEVRKGEIVGIMGCNGSGKSTLLQIICGTMQASDGEVKTHGRISALLELGAGFNPEFTGRENVYLNGAIMGFSRKEMEARIPAIEEFADVGAFFDQPVKTYSSGMFVRVAFAAAINIDPEILIVDEALAVGDAKFQHKCYTKLESFRAEGKTIVLVTHDAGQITGHCDRAILLDHGAMLMDGEPRDVVDKYIELLFGKSDIKNKEEKKELNLNESDECIIQEKTENNNIIENRVSYCKNEARYGDHRAEILDCYFIVDNEIEPKNIFRGQKVSLCIRVKFNKSIKPIFGFAIKNITGIEVYGSNTFMQKVAVPFVDENEIKTARFSFQISLQPGEYFIDAGIAEVDGSPGGVACDVRRSVAMFLIQEKEGKSNFDGLVDLSPEYNLIK